MLNPRLDALPDYPFVRLRALLGDRAPGLAPLDLSLGEPQHAPPALLAESLARSVAGWRGYPPIAGAPVWKQAVGRWLCRRYGLDSGMIDPAFLLPASGTREVLYALGQLLLPGTDGSDLVLIPDPAYLPYVGAAVMNGARPWPVRGGFADVPADIWAQARVVYACSPSNPQGTIMGLDDWTGLIETARRHGAVVVADECYSEIYDDAAPVGALQACQHLGGSLDNVLVVNSLSKRSNAAGLRSGFVTGDPKLVGAFARMRAYGAAGMPLPIQDASATLWDDEDHVIHNRTLYRQKIDLAQDILGTRLGFRRPQGGFCLWLDTSDWGETGEQAALRLWCDQGVKVLPGAYMSAAGADDTTQAHRFKIRVVLVHKPDDLRDALTRFRAPPVSS